MATYYMGADGKFLERKLEKGTYTMNEDGTFSRKAEAAPVPLARLNAARNKQTLNAVQANNDALTEESEKRTWFQPGSFEDGYQAGDVYSAVTGTATDIGENAGAGVIGIGEKILDALVFMAPYAAEAQFMQNGGYYNLTNAEAFKQQNDSAKQIAQDFIKKDLYDENAVAKKIISDPVKALTGVDSEKESVLGEKSDALAQSAGQLAGTAALQAVGVPAWLVTGLTSFGGEADSALKQGATYEEAGLSATITAGAEVLTEKLSGGIDFGQGTLDEAVTKQLARGISNKVVRTLANMGVQTVGEGAEEVISGVMGAVGQKLTYMDEAQWKELFSSEDAWESFIGGAVLGAGGSSVQAMQSAAKGVDYTSGLTQNEQAVADKLYKDRVAEAEKNGKVTQKQKAKIYDDILTKLDAGRISAGATGAAQGGRPTVEELADAIFSSGKKRAQEGQQKAVTTPTLTREAYLKALDEVVSGKTNSGTGALETHSDAQSKEHISLEDYANQESPVWRNVAYDDDTTKADITQKTHDAMVSSGAIVQVSDDVTENVGKSFPDLRSMKKKERTPILKEAISKLKNNIRQFLSGLTNQNFEFEVNGKILEAKLYGTGINEVLEKVTQDKASMLYSTEEIFHNARYLYSTPDYDGDPNVYRWNYFYTPVQIGEETVGVRIAVRDMVKGTDGDTPESQIYNWGIKKDASLDGGSHGPKVASSDVSSDASNNNILQNGPVVNTNEGGASRLPRPADVNGSAEETAVDRAQPGGYDNSTNTGGVNYGTGRQGQNGGGQDQNGARFYEGIRTDESRRPQIPGGRGEENSGSVGASVLGESAGITNELFSAEDIYTPEEGSILRNAQDRFAAEYGIDCRIVKASAWKLKNPAAIQNGIVYVKDDIHEGNIPSLIPHEATHAMKQKVFSPYIEFAGRTADMLSQGSAQANRLMKMAANHASIDLFGMTDHDFGRLFDELNSIVYGFKQGGVLEDSRFDYGQWIPDAFLDFDSYIRELDGIHEQFKQEQRSKRTPAAEESVGAAPSGFDPISHLQYEYGTIPEGENAVRDDSLPKSTDGKTRVSYTARTVKGAQATPDEFADLIDKEVTKGGLTYIPITNSETTQKCVEHIKAVGWLQAKAEWSAAVHAGKTGAEMSATGALLLNNAANAEDKTAWLEILHDYQIMGTNTAQGMQALRILKTLAPEDTLYMIRRSVEQMVDDMKLDTDIELDEDLLNEFEEAETDEARDEALDKIQKNVADQIPSTFMEKFTALRYMNMLGNLRTQVRNIAGNAGMKGISAVKNAIAAGIETVANKASGGKIGKTKSLAVSKEQMEAAKADFDQFKSIVLGGGKYADSRQASTEFAQGVQDRRTIFKGRNIVSKGLEGYRKVTNWAMEKGDLIFSKAAYARALAGYLKANGVTETDYSKVDTALMDKARLYAAQEAQEQTFRDTNVISEAISQRYRGNNKFKKAVSVLGEGIVPFRKTPANVLVRAEEYSPLGIINSVYYSVKATQKGSEVTASQVINSWSKTLTGSGIFALGMLLSNLGVLAGGPDEDEGKEDFESLNGWQNYAIILPDGTNITIDWLTPAAMPLLMGAEFWELIRDGGFEGKDLEQALLSIADPMIEMSMLQGINDTLENIQYADSNLGQLAANAALSYLTQGLTNTALGQLERTFEDSRMTTYVDKDSAVPDWIQRVLGKASAKTPGWDYNQVPYINAWGEEEENPEWYANGAHNMLSPAYIEKGASTELTEELNRLNGAQGDVNVYPSSPDKTITVNKEKRNLSSEEWVALAKAQGQTAKGIVEDIISSKYYDGLSDEQKAKAIRYAYDYAREHARVKTLDDYNAYSAKWMSGIEGKEAETILRKVAAGDAFSELPIDKAAMLQKAINELFDKPRETKPDGTSYTDVRTIQKVETVAQSSLTEKEQQEAMEDILDDKAYEKYLKILDAGYDNDEYAESYRIYVDAEGTKAETIRELQQELEITYAAAKVLYEIYEPRK